MGLFQKPKRVAAAIVAAGTLTAGLIVGTVGPASASTISKNFIQLCAQGNYSAVLAFPARGGLQSYVVTPGTCLLQKWGTIGSNGGWETVNVVDSSTHRILGTTWYNGNQSGIGFGAVGVEGGSQWVVTW